MHAGDVIRPNDGCDVVDTFIGPDRGVLVRRVAPAELVVIEVARPYVNASWVAATPSPGAIGGGQTGRLSAWFRCANFRASPRKSGKRKKLAAQRTILVADDHEPTREALVLSLRKQGYRVLAAEDGVKAIRLCREQHVDVVVSDVHMPRKDGLTVLRETKAAGTKVILLSADETIVDEAHAAGAVEFLRKPCDLSQLLAAVERAFGARTMATG